MKEQFARFTLTLNGLIAIISLSWWLVLMGDQRWEEAWIAAAVAVYSGLNFLVSWFD